MDLSSIIIISILAALCAACAVGWITAASNSSRERGKSAEFEDEARAARERAAELLSKLSAVSAERDAARAYADSLKEDLKKTSGEKNAAEKLLAAAEERVCALAEKIESRAKEEKNLRDKMEADFENLSNRLLESIGSGNGFPL